MSDITDYSAPVPDYMDGERNLLAKLLKLAGNAVGVDIINDTDAHTGKWFRVEALATASFTSLAGTDVSLEGSFPVALGLGASVRGNFTNIKLASGTVAAYKQDSTATT